MADSGRADEDLLRAAAAGSQAAFGELVDRHQRQVRGFLRRLLPDLEEADDLAQETFMAAWSSAGRFRGAASVRSWLLGIAWRKAKGAQRSWFRRLARDGAYHAKSGLERPIGAQMEDRLALDKALNGLSLEQRGAVALCLAGDFSHGDAAEVLGLPLGTVKSHVTRGRA